MKYTVIYARTVKIKSHGSMTVGLHMEFDTRLSPCTHVDEAFQLVRNRVEEWINLQTDRLLSTKRKQ